MTPDPISTQPTQPLAPNQREKSISSRNGFMLNKKILIVFTMVTVILVGIFISYLLQKGSTESKTGYSDSQVQELSDSFGKTSGDSGFNANTDLNGDKNVDVLDYQELSNKNRKQ